MINKTIFVAHPRSGHHWLMRTLQDYFGDEMKYCEFYTHCNTIGCIEDCNIQKNHDFGLDLEIPDDWNVIVQCRNPNDAILSLFKKTKESDYIKFIYEHLYWYYQWRTKWNRPENYVVNYEDMVADPTKILYEVIFRLCGEVNIDKARVVTTLNKNKYE